MSELYGFVDHIIYRKIETGYTILSLLPEGTVEDEELELADEIVCTGTFPSVSEGENIRMQGEYVTHKSYGRQFAMKSYEIAIPEGEAAIERYLASGAVKGIGSAIAKRIIKKFKADTFRIIEEEPERLAEIKGISMKRAMEISDAIIEKKEMRDTMMYLAEFGLGPTICLRIYNEYGPKTMEIMQKNPYRLADEIVGVGFKMADAMAQKIGIRPTSEFRICCGIQYALGEAAGQGHTFLPKEELTYRCRDILGTEGEVIEAGIAGMLMDKKLVQEGENIYSSVYYHLEKNSAALLYTLDERYDISPAKVDTAIAAIEQAESLTFDEIQKEAISGAAKRGVFVLTGGPGTGKTTTIRGIISYFEMEGLEVSLAAPTGRAAKRMTEATGHPARTIHRLLEVSGKTMEDDVRKPKGGMFDRNEENPLETDVVIIDEMSMVDIALLHALLKAIPLGTRLVLVGDVNQLPSVGPGNVLKDIIESKLFFTVELKKIFRQDDTGDIVVAAHQIQQGTIPRIDNKSKDFFLMRRDNANAIIGITEKLVSDNMPRYVDATPFEVQVLCPMKKGFVGVENMNQKLQAFLNPPSPGKKEHSFGEEKLFREGDKVMQVKNNYQMEWHVTGKNGFEIDRGTGVFNGDMGIIREINDFDSFIAVEFEEGRLAEYPFRDCEELELAYATTIHKAQGSEYPAVVIPLMKGPELLMNRNLIYTAITRAIKCVVMVGEPEVFLSMVKNTHQMVRYSGLKNMLVEYKKS